MDEQLYDAFEVCLAARHTGVDLERCLALYPDVALELRAALEGAWYAQILVCSDVPTVPLNRSRARFRLRIAQLDDQRRMFFSWGFLPRLVFVVLIVILVFSLSWNSLLVASAKSLPGDSLYPLKRVVEKVALSLPPIVESRHEHEIENEYYHRRAEEIENLFRLGRSEKVSLEGVLTETSATQMLVEGIPIVADAGTRIVGKIDPGIVVKVEGLTDPKGFVKAAEIHVRYYALVGKVNEIGETMWILAGSKIRVLPGAQIDPSLHVGDQALAMVYSDDDGALATRAVIKLSKAAIESELQIDPSTLPGAVHLDGVVASMAENIWEIGDHTISITAKTEIKDEIAVGNRVRVHAWQFSDGTLVAGEIVNAQSLVKDKAREVEIRDSVSDQDDHEYDTILQESDSKKENDSQGIKEHETNEETSVKESEDHSNASDSEEKFSNSSEDKHDDSGSANGEEDHEEQNSVDEIAPED